LVDLLACELFGRRLHLISVLLETQHPNRSGISNFTQSKVYAVNHGGPRKQRSANLQAVW
jgi:hypothetical protein